MEKNKKGPQSADVRAEIEKKLALALAELKETIGEKKFSRRIKKAAKILGKNVSPAAAKVPAVVKRKAKKAKVKVQEKA